MALLVFVLQRVENRTGSWRAKGTVGFVKRASPPTITRQGDMSEGKGHRAQD